MLMYLIKMHKGDMFVPNHSLDPRDSFEFESSQTALAKIIGLNTLRYDTPITSTLNGWRVFEYQDKSGDIVMTVQFKEALSKKDNIKVIEMLPLRLQDLVSQGLAKGGRHV